MSTQPVVAVSTANKLANYTNAINQKLEALSNRGFPWIMWYRSDASGDLPHVVAAMKSQIYLGVVVFDFGGLHKAQSILD